MAFAAALSSGPPPKFERSLPFVALARAACRDPNPGAAEPAIARIDELLSSAEQLLDAGGEQSRAAFGLVLASGVIAATELPSASTP